MGETDDQKIHLRAAVSAAARRDAREYVIELAASHVLDGVAHSMERHWPRLDCATLEEVMVETADALYTRAAEGRVVRSPAAFLWGAANNVLKKRHGLGRLDTDQFDDESRAHNAAGDREDEPGPDREVMRAEALRFARSILPQLGQENIVRVMAYIFDCVEAGELYIDNKAIAEALGLSVETVRKTKHRGFKRLEREARKHGVLLDEGLAEHRDEHEEEQYEEGE